MPSRCLPAALALIVVLPAAAQRAAVPLNDYTRLGQRFTVERKFVSLAVSVPSWSDNEGGLTLTLWDSPARGRRLARRVVTGVIDNEMVELRTAAPLPAGSYYWEVSERTGTTRIGLYADALAAETDDCAYLDSVADRARRFLFEIVGGPLPRTSIERLIDALIGGTVEQQGEACRELALHGTPAAVPALARLLDDPAVAHMARFALEAIPGAAADAALRAALRRLHGSLLVGAINSIAARRDAAAVPRLTELLAHEDSAVADAAAVALGQIGDSAAATALLAALDRAMPHGAGLFEGALRGAGRRLEAGDRAGAAALYNRLDAPATPGPVRLAAARGAVLARGADGLERLLALLRETDPERRGVALFIAHHELPGTGITLALAAALPELAAESRALLVDALAGRGDPAALPALTAAAAAGDLPVRLAAVRALPRFGAADALTALLDDPDEELRSAAQAGLSALPADLVAEVAGELLSHADAEKRQVAVRLIQRRWQTVFAPALADLLDDPIADVRVAATKALEELGGAEQIEPLRDALVACADEAQAAALESALAAVCARAEPAAAADRLIAGLEAAPPARRAAMLRVLGGIGGEAALQAVRAAVAGPAGEVRTAAFEALCAWPSGAAAPDLLRLAGEAPAPEERLAALRGLLRLAAGSDLATEQRLALCDAAAERIERDEERLLLLSALGSVGDYAALERVVPHLAAEATREAACAAALAIAEKLADSAEAGRLVEPLEQVAGATTTPDFATRAAALLERLRGR